MVIRWGSKGKVLLPREGTTKARKTKRKKEQSNLLLYIACDN
jgi:hypothetical protein